MTDTIVVVSAGQNAGPSYGAYDASPITWSTVRGMKGSVYFKPTNIGSNWSDSWYMAYFTVELMNQDGSHFAGPVTMEKQYGVIPGWTYLGYARAGHNIRLRTSVEVDRDGDGNFIQSWCEWEGSLMWDNLP